MSILKKLFGSKKKETSSVEGLVESTVEGLVEKAQFDLQFAVRSEKNDRGEDQITIEFSGKDEEIIKDREGQVIDSIQLFLKRVIQHHFPEDRTEVVIDCNGYREENNQQLVELAERLKGVALEKGRSVYIRALPPKDRKIVHQYLANDERIKSRSIGEGLYKKIKIYPIKASGAENSRGNEGFENSDAE